MVQAELPLLSIEPRCFTTHHDHWLVARSAKASLTYQCKWTTTVNTKFDRYWLAFYEGKV